MNMRGDMNISVPKWAWAILCSVAATILAGGATWCTSVNAKLGTLEKNSMDRAAVIELLEKQNPYVRDKGMIDGRMMATEKLLDRHDSDVRRLTETMARVEAKLDALTKSTPHP